MGIGFQVYTWQYTALVYGHKSFYYLQFGINWFFYEYFSLSGLAYFWGFTVKNQPLSRLGHSHGST